MRIFRDGFVGLQVVERAVVRLAVHEQPLGQRAGADEDVHAHGGALLIGVVPGFECARLDGVAALVGKLCADRQDGEQRLLEHRVVLDHVGCHGVPLGFACNDPSIGRGAGVAHAQKRR
ncbi:MAG: hypothetical protein ACLRZO_08840 [Eggerthella lenta]